ncbi:MAG: endonuclease domain-containing protein [Pseudonocardia sp.]|nr:endonuclease domain-containing protein [Pseudonocardia sp.]
MTVPGWPVVFRGSEAIAAGLVTPGKLRSRAFRRLLPDVYAPASGGPADLTLRSIAAYRWAHDRGVLSGYSAAELLGRSCGPWSHPAEVTVAGEALRSRDEVIVRRDRLHPGEITEVDGIRVTTSMRTAFDLARRLPLVEAVVAVDNLARGRFAPDLLLNFAARYAGARGVKGVPDVLAYADAKSGSPPESRLRMLLVLAGLPRPAVQHTVLDDVRHRAIWLDLAYPEHRLGVEYDGGDHLRPDRVVQDIARHTRLVAAGWRVLRYTAWEIRNETDRIVADVATAVGIDRTTLRPIRVPRTRDASHGSPGRAG